MSRDLAPWVWWAGRFGDVECEGTYELGGFATRQEAIDAAIRDDLGDCDEVLFYVIEAQMGEFDDAGDLQLFSAHRNKELLCIVDGAAVVPK